MNLSGPRLSRNVLLLSLCYVVERKGITPWVLDTKQAQPGLQLQGAASPHRGEEGLLEQGILLPQPGKGRGGGQEEAKS